MYSITKLSLRREALKKQQHFFAKNKIQPITADKMHYLGNKRATLRVNQEWEKDSTTSKRTTIKNSHVTGDNA